MRRFSNSGQALLALAVILMGAAAQAETDGNDQIQIEEIVVFGRQDSYLSEIVSSATKTDANLFDVPLSVSTINDTLLKDLRAETLSDAYGYTVFDDADTNARLIIADEIVVNQSP